MGMATGRKPYFSSRKPLRSGQPSPLAGAGLASSDFLAASVVVEELADAGASSLAPGVALLCARAGTPTKRVMTASARATLVGVIDRTWHISSRLVELVRSVDADLGGHGEVERLNEASAGRAGDSPAPRPRPGRRREGGRRDLGAEMSI